MNILLLVFTILTLLTITTYTRLQTYLDNAGVRIEYEKYMAHSERDALNSIEERKYKTTRAKQSTNQQKTDSSSTQGQTPTPPPPPKNTFALLNLYPLVGKVTPNMQNVDAQSIISNAGDTVKVFQRIMENLYSDKRFYKEALKTHPQLSEDIVRQMIESITKAPCPLKFTNKKDLANIPLIDEDLREVYYNMLNGQKASYTVDKHGKEVKTNNGYPSLLDYVMLSQQPTKIRVFLARKALLQSLFRDPQPIIDRRKELYQQLDQGAVTAQDASSEFAQRFQDQTNAEVDLSMLDFSITKTAPPND